jgi:hypothetical protein
MEPSMKNNLIRDIVKNIIEEQRLVMNIEDDISLTIKTTVKEQEDIQNSWPKSITYKENLLFDQYNHALRVIIKDLNIDKTKVDEMKLKDDDYWKKAYPEADRNMSTSEDNDAETIIKNRTRVTGDIRYFAYVPEADRFILGFDMNDVSSIGKDNQRYVAIVTCEFRFKNDNEQDSEVIIEKNERFDVSYQDNLDYIVNKVKVEYKGKDVIIIFTKEDEYTNDIYT